MVASVFVRFGDDPGGGVADAEIKDLPGGNEAVEGLHELRNRRREVPPVNVELERWISMREGRARQELTISM